MTGAPGNPWAGSLSGLLSGIPPFPGKVRFIDALGRVVSHIGDGQAVLSPWPGVRFEVDLRDRIQRQMWGGCYEIHVRKCLEALLRMGDIFLDVGAHVGYHTVLAAGLVGAEGTVVAFEPDPALYDRLTHNTRQFPQVRAFPCAVWQTTGTLLYERSAQPGESGWGTLTEVRDLSRGQHFAVPAIALDGWFQEMSPARVRGIKVDAEGSELAILRGARKLIGQLRPAIILETNDTILKQAGTSAAELGAYVSGMGYEVFGLSWMRLTPLPVGATPSACEVLCIPEEHAEELLLDLHKAGFCS